MEVDIDGSNTIDFFEYLSIANMLQDKKGWYKSLSTKTPQFHVLQITIKARTMPRPTPNWALPFPHEHDRNSLPIITKIILNHHLKTLI